MALILDLVNVLEKLEVVKTTKKFVIIVKLYIVATLSEKISKLNKKFNNFIVALQMSRIVCYNSLVRN